MPLIMPSGEVTSTASVMLLSTLVQVVLGDGRLAQLLPHAIQRTSQLADLVAARDLMRPRVVALADALGGLDQLEIGRSQPLREQPRDGPSMSVMSAPAAPMIHALRAKSRCSTLLQL